MDLEIMLPAAILLFSAASGIACCCAKKFDDLELENRRPTEASAEDARRAALDAGQSRIGRPRSKTI